MIDAQRAPSRRLDAALRYLVTYLDGPIGAKAIGVDPAFALESLAAALTPQVDALVRLLGDAFDQIPGVATGDVSRRQAAEMFVRLAYSHYLVPHTDPELFLATMRSFAGLPERSLTNDTSTQRSTRHGSRTA